MLLKFAPYLVLLAIASAAGIIRWRQLSLPEKMVAILIPVAALTESTAIYASYRYGNSQPVYHVYSPVEFLLISMYFNYVIPVFKRHNLGLLIGLAGVILSILNSIYLQKLTSFNTYFLLFEGTIVMVYCLLSLREILLDEEHLPYGFANFWITVCFIVFWGTTFTGWGIYTVLDKHDMVLNPIVNNLLIAASYIFYFGMAVVFILHKKLIPSRA